MASLDFVVDLTEKFVAQKIEYAIITVQKGKSGDRVHVFHDIRSKDTIKSLEAGLKQLDTTVSKIKKDLSKGEK